VTAVCVVAWLAGLVFVLALCKAAARGDEMMEEMRGK
jgi:hypothetical protein